MRFTLLSLFFLASSTSCASSDAERLQRLAQRRSGIAIICHRGASEFAKENTLEAYRAAFELGADGNEIDIRVTKDGVLVCFHDDMLDVQLKAFGDVSDYTWHDLQRIPFRDGGQKGYSYRIPTLEQALRLHRKYAGLVHLDVKQPGIDAAIVALIDKLDMWPHISSSSGDNAQAIHRHPQYQPRTYKAGLYLDRSEVFPDVIAEALKKSGDDLMVDDPRGALVALGRAIGKVSRGGVIPETIEQSRPGPQVTTSLLKTIRSSDKTPEGITARARAADLLLEYPGNLIHSRRSTEEIADTLSQRARFGTLHPDWRYHGLDGAIALRTLLLLRIPYDYKTLSDTASMLQLCRLILWRDDPDLAPLNNPKFNVPPSWVDWRVKNVIFPALRFLPGRDTEQLCRDYLALSDDEAGKLGPPQFEPAARTLLAISPNTSTAIELMNHRLQVVRGRAILDCLARHKETWALDALRQAAPHALAYIPPQ